MLKIFFNNVVFLAIVSCSSTMYSQVPFERIRNSGSRSASLGDAYVSQAYDVSSMYWNPSSLVFLDRNSIVTNSMTEKKFTVAHFSITIPIHFATEHSVGIGISEKYVGDFWNKPFFVSREANIGYATKLSPIFSIGGLVSIQYDKTIASSLLGSKVLIGVFYVPSPGISYGATYRGIRSTHFIHSPLSSDPPDIIGYEEQSPQTMEVGTSFQFPTTTKYTIANFLFASEKRFGEKRIRNKGGIEISPLRQTAFRIGLTRTDSSVIIRYGIGIRLGFICFDYAFAKINNSGSFHQISLSIELKNGF